MAKKKQTKITDTTPDIFEDGKNILVYLPTHKLYPHPDNPRKDLGDLEELANSIKANGIMQNLTVVPRFESNTYTVIIGHRRLAAAKLAELDEVPCVIVDMTPQEQLSTMLLENMQRSDLTFYEQAQGFKQLMIDFGQTVESISAKTGFSQTTVRRRLKLAELDQDKLKKASEKQISMKDLERLNDIEDVDERNKLLDDLGTNNFEFRYNNALSEQKKKEQIQKWRDYLTSKGAVEISSKGNEYTEIAWKYVSNYDTDHEALGEKITEAQAYYFEIQGLYINLCIAKEKTEDIAEENDILPENSHQESVKEQNKRKKKLEDTFKLMFKLRCDFIKKLSEQAIHKCKDKLLISFLKIASNHSYDLSISEDYLKEFFDFEVADGCDINDEVMKPYIDATPNKLFLVYLLSMAGDSPTFNCIDYSGHYIESWGEDLQKIYSALEVVGYEMSDEEKSLLDGTSELYLPKADK